jgi:hypothetical protein
MAEVITTQKILIARRFELRSADNYPWGTLEVTEEGEVQFNMLNRDGREEIVFACHKKERALSVLPPETALDAT